jgi:protein SMG6
MLFTNIELDNFKDTLARFLERLEIEDVEEHEHEWIIMGIINICAVLEYSKPAGIIRCTTSFPIKELGPGIKVMAKKVEKDVKMDVDDAKNEEASKAKFILHSPATSAASSTTSGPEENPASFTMTL